VPEKADGEWRMEHEDLEMKIIHHHQHGTSVEDTQDEGAQRARRRVYQPASSTFSTKQRQCDQADAMVPCKLGSTIWHGHVCVAASQLDDTEDDLEDGVRNIQNEI